MPECSNCGRHRPGWAMYNKSKNQLPTEKVKDRRGHICGDCVEQLERCGDITHTDVEGIANDAVE